MADDPGLGNPAASDPSDNDFGTDDFGTFDEKRNYEDRILLENGHIPDELSDDERRQLLADYDERGDPDNSRLSNIDETNNESG